VRLQREDHVVEADRFAGRAEHPRHAEAPDIRVEDADRAAAPRERRREVHRDARLAHAALTRRDRHDRRLRRERDLVLGGRGVRAGCVGATELGHELLPVLAAHRCELHIDALYALEGSHGRRHVARDPVLQRAALDREEHVHADDPAVDLDRLQHPDLIDRAADLGVPHALEGLADLRFGGHGLSSRCSVVRSPRRSSRGV
jgi:hypothetical protein